jgi:hypothetical protein
VKGLRHATYATRVLRGILWSKVETNLVSSAPVQAASATAPCLALLAAVVGVFHQCLIDTTWHSFCYKASCLSDQLAKLSQLSDWQWIGKCAACTCLRQFVGKGRIQRPCCCRPFPVHAVDDASERWGPVSKNPNPGKWLTMSNALVIPSSPASLGGLVPTSLPSRLSAPERGTSRQ